ncbi:MAG: hypothetical protein NT169_27975 [Chloroflexi bacterium]|nr:hypothetical protein [Chloroflexota bacterium]
MTEGRVKRPVLLVLIVLALLLAAGTVLTMSSANYRLDWFELMTGVGGPRMDSAQFAADVTAGQPAIVASASANYGAQMGYWSAFTGRRVFLPMIVKH